MPITFQEYETPEEFLCNFNFTEQQIRNLFKEFSTRSVGLTTMDDRIFLSYNNETPRIRTFRDKFSNNGFSCYNTYGIGRFKKCIIAEKLNI